MTFSANFSLVLPEIVLAIAALVLLVAGAFRGKVGPVSYTHLTLPTNREV